MGEVKDIPNGEDSRNKAHKLGISACEWTRSSLVWMKPRLCKGSI